jgi:cytochrome P450
MSANADVIDFLSPELHADPYAVYAHFRETAPVQLGAPIDPFGTRVWHVLRYADCLSVLKDNRITRHGPGFDGPVDLSLGDPAELFYQLTRRSVLFNDPPDHTRLRALIGGVFTPRMVARLSERITAVTTDLLDAAAQRGGLDVVHDYALPLTLTIIAAMLGVPQSDKGLLDQWGKVLVRAVDYKRTAAIFDQAIATTMEIFQYFVELIAEKRANPSDDLLSQIIHPTDGGEPLDDLAITITAVTLLMAGHDTTVNLIGNATLLLLQHPEQPRPTQANPDQVSAIVEEALRYHSPAQSTTRYATSDINLSGVTVPQGQQVSLILGSANHDPAAFPDPERFDVSRSGPRHLSFGMGMHYCVGAPLARQEANIALPALFDRFPTLQMRDPQPHWRDTISFRGLERLDVSM